jgi:hypothetical protein
MKRLSKNEMARTMREHNKEKFCEYLRMHGLPESPEPVVAGKTNRTGAERQWHRSMVRSTGTRSTKRWCAPVGIRTSQWV